MTSQYTMLPFEELLAIPLKNGLTKPKSVRGTGYPLVNMGELFANERIDEQVSMDLAPLSEAEFSSFLLQEADLLFARQSLVLSGAGKCSYVKKLVQDTTFESHIIRARINQSKASPLYYFYFFMSPQGKQAMLSIVEQVAAAGIRGSDLKRMLVPVPPLPEQRAIAAILSALDDKIELNRQMNKTLEEMAQAIFKEWFVDFGPFRDGGMQDSELGPIPLGWEVGTIGSVADINSRVRRKDYQHQLIHYIDISSVAQGQLEKTTPYKLSEAPSRAQRLVSNQDILWSCVRPNRRSYYYVLNPADNIVVSTGFAVLSPVAIPGSYLYQWVTTDQFVDYLTANADGSAYPAVRADHFANALCIIPPANILLDFDTCVSPMRNAIARNSIMNNTLSSVRDALLPKLMSGEIRVPVDAEPA